MQGRVHYECYDVCEFCGNPLTGKEKRIGCGSHESCWKTWCDRVREEESNKGSDRKSALDRLGNVVGDKPIYDENGNRFKDYEYGELIDGN